MYHVHCIYLYFLCQVHCTNMYLYFSHHHLTAIDQNRVLSRSNRNINSQLWILGRNGSSDSPLFWWLCISIKFWLSPKMLTSDGDTRGANSLLLYNLWHKVSRKGKLSINGKVSRKGEGRVGPYIVFHISLLHRLPYISHTLTPFLPSFIYQPAIYSLPKLLDTKFWTQSCWHTSQLVQSRNEMSCYQ